MITNLWIIAILLVAILILLIIIYLGIGFIIYLGSASEKDVFKDRAHTILGWFYYAILTLVKGLPKDDN